MAEQEFDGRLFLLTVAGLAPFAVWMALSSRFCPDIDPQRYSVAASDVNGRLEYCVGRHIYGGRGYPDTALIEPGATCGTDKAKLVALAESRTQKSAAALKACRSRTTLESLKELYQRWFSKG